MEDPDDLPVTEIARHERLESLTKSDVEIFETDSVTDEMLVMWILKIESKGIIPCSKSNFHIKFGTELDVCI